MPRSILPAACAALLLLPSLAGAQIAPPSGRWTANIRPSLSMSSNIGASTKRMYGSVKIVPSTTGPALSWDVEIHLTSDRPGETLMWTISPGRCGVGAIPFALPTELPLFEVRTNGTGDLTANVKFALDGNGAYHLDIYRGGSQPEHVIACAALKYSKPD